MSRKKKPLPILENVSIIAAGSKGKSIAKIDGLVIFVQGAVPGDICDVQLLKKRKGRADARMLKLIKPSPYRVEPECKHFGVCGGCNWQHLSYDEQLSQKRQQIIDALTRIAQIEFPEPAPTIGSDKTTFYRNKLEYTFGSNRWFTIEELQSLGEITDRKALGYHMSGSFEKILQIDECLLQPEPSNSIRQFVNTYAREQGLSFYNIRENHGLLRNLTIRTSTIGETMVILAVAQPDQEAIDALLASLTEAFPDLTSVQYVINEKKNDTIWDQDIKVFKGKDHIIEKLNNGAHDLHFKIGAKSFFQTNPEQAQVLYQEAVRIADLQADDVVYDLYCGAGTISLFIANKVKKVFGVEIVPEAIEDARLNTDMNEIKNVSFATGDLKDLFTEELVAQHGVPNVVIIDPPRAGMHKDVVVQLLKLRAPKIIYISCDPATQARDLGLLDESYRVSAVQPVDMFPHTHHIENIVRLDLR